MDAQLFLLTYEYVIQLLPNSTEEMKVYIVVAALVCLIPCVQAIKGAWVTVHNILVFNI